MNLLQLALRADCLITGAVALLQLVAASWLATWLGISAGILRSSGLVLLLFVAYLAYCILQKKLGRRHLDFIITVNGLWAIACLLFLYAERFALTTLGMAFVLIQVVAVTLFAALEYYGSRMLSRKESPA